MSCQLSVDLLEAHTSHRPPKPSIVKQTTTRDRLTDTATIWTQSTQILAVGTLDDELGPAGILGCTLRRQLRTDLVEAVAREALDSLRHAGCVEERKSDRKRYEVDIGDVGK